MTAVHFKRAEAMAADLSDTPPFCDGCTVCWLCWAEIGWAELDDWHITQTQLREREREKELNHCHASELNL